MKVPSFLYRNTATYEAYQGETAYGPTWAAGVAIKCRIEPKHSLRTTANGEERLASVVCYVSEVAPQPEDRITFDDRTYQVIDSLTVSDPHGHVLEYEVYMI